ncbi:MAG: undecaprenyl-phosphate glucose phosphotransferase [Pseudomonadota bacterium]
MNAPFFPDAALARPVPPRWAIQNSIPAGIALIGDVAAVLAIGALLMTGPETAVDTAPGRFAVGFAAFAVPVLMWRAGLYRLETILRPGLETGRMAVAVATAFLFLLTVIFSLEAASAYPRSWLLALVAGAAGAILVIRVGIARILRQLCAGRLIGRSLVVLGGGEQARRLLAGLRRMPPELVTIDGIYGHGPEKPQVPVAGYRVLGGVEQLVQDARRGRIDDVIVALPWMADRQMAETVRALRELPVNVYVSSDLAGFSMAFRQASRTFRGLPVYAVAQRPISGWQTVSKTVLDYVAATAGLVLLSPLLALIALAIRLDSPGPVLFRQRRFGFNNQPFEIYKFRTMYHRGDPDQRDRRVQQARRADPRITRVGAVLRRLSLDELPQLLNVIDGSMSLIGPRPHAVVHNEDFAAYVRGYFARHNVKPGITGWAQVNGLRGETDTPDKIEARVAHDIYYTDNWSLALDLRILALTVIRVPFQNTAY